jgi:type II secretory pathway pseudopilin PulG
MIDQRHRAQGIGHTLRAFTLIETLVAVSLLTVAIAAPMSLTTQSLSSAYYARDQMTAFHLAQEAIESVRAVRDENILGNEADLLAGIPIEGEPFIIDTRDNEMTICNQGSPAQCPPLRVPTSSSDPMFYAYRNVDSSEDIYTAPLGWTDTRFRRTIRAEMTDGSNDEMKVTVTVSWQTGAFQPRTITMRTNLYRWVDLGT